MESAVWIAPLIHSQVESDDCINLQERRERQTTVALQNEQSLWKVILKQARSGPKVNSFVCSLKAVGSNTQNRPGT